MKSPKGITDMDKEPVSVSRMKEYFGKEIFIVEDNRDFADELRDLLEDIGFKTVCLDDADEVIERVDAGRPDMILMDLKLGANNGFQLACNIKQNVKTSGIPIIGMTGFFTKKEHLRLMKMFGINDCLIKPIDPRVLMAMIDKVFKNASLDTSEA